MAKYLGALEQAIMSAAKEALGAMQLQLAVEADDAFSSDIWSWFSKGGGDSGKTEMRDINDTGDLMNSITFNAPTLNGTHIEASLEWQSSHEDGPYAEIVHNGRKAYFQEEEGERDYAARPWTFLLAPQEQRNTGQLNAVAGQDPETLPDDRWKAAMRQFETQLQTSLAQKVAII
jgi:hypothetical protein